MKIAAKSLLIELEGLTDEAALAIETATKLSTQLDKESNDELQQVTCDEARYQHNFVSPSNLCPLKNGFREE